MTMLAATCFRWRRRRCETSSFPATAVAAAAAVVASAAAVVVATAAMPPAPPSIFFAKLGLLPGQPEGHPYHHAHRGTTIPSPTPSLESTVKCLAPAIFAATAKRAERRRHKATEESKSYNE